MVRYFINKTNNNIMASTKINVSYNGKTYVYKYDNILISNNMRIGSVVFDTSISQLEKKFVHFVIKCVNNRKKENRKKENAIKRQQYNIIKQERIKNDTVSCETCNKQMRRDSFIYHCNTKYHISRISDNINK